MITISCYDTIMNFQICPYCHTFQSFEAQTYDLGSRMYIYDPLSVNWYKPKMLQKDFRTRISVFPKFPLDREHKVWKNQAERIEAEATVPDEFQKLKFVEVITSCHSVVCQEWANREDLQRYGYISGFGRSFEGKIKIEKGKLIGNIYDLILKSNKHKPAIYIVPKNITKLQSSNWIERRKLNKIKVKPRRSPKKTWRI